MQLEIGQRRKYFNAFKIKPVLTLYRIHLFEMAVVFEKIVDFPKKSHPLCINYSLISPISDQNSEWSWDNLN